MCGWMRNSSGGEGGRQRVGKRQPRGAARMPVLGEAQEAGELAGKDLLL